MNNLSRIVCIKNSALSGMVINHELNTRNSRAGEQLAGLGEFKETILKRIMGKVNVQKPVVGATVRCTSAIKGETVYILDDEGKVCISDLSILTKHNIMLSESFQYCQYCNDKKCPEDREIEGNEWKGYDDTNRVGIDKEELDKNQSYMICLTGYGVIYFTNSGQTIKDFAEDFAILNRYVNEDVFKSMGWDVDIFKKVYGEDVFEKLKECMYQYDITNPYSVCMFLATLGEESGNGGHLTEVPKPYEKLSYRENTRGAGLIQVTGLVQKEFLKYLENEMLKPNSTREDKELLEEIQTYIRGYYTFTTIVDGKEKTVCDNPKNATVFIAENYPIESAVWYWAAYEMCPYWEDISQICSDDDGEYDTISLNQYVCNVTEKLDIGSMVEKDDTPLENVFLVTQYHVNGRRWFPYRLQRIAEGMYEEYSMENGELILKLSQEDPVPGQHNAELPSNWSTRAEDWKQMTYELFG